MRKKDQFNKLRKEMLEDKTLPLRVGATNLVLGEGNLSSDIMFIGEGPGYWEDQKGRPFVGAAGKFLDQLLHSIKLPREGVFISNVVCYRPPGNRDPQPEEIAAFQPYVDRLIELIKPEVIVTLGRFSMSKFLPNARISIVHGRPHIVDWKGSEITVIPMYHPAAGLRRQEIKMQLIEDFKKIPETLREIKIGKKENVEQVELI